jgi:HK97 family phage prohead protease
MEYKLFSPDLKIADRDGDNDPGTVEGYASTFSNFDDVGERVVKGAFASHLTGFLESGFIAWNHDWAAAPIATPLDAYEDDHGLFVRAQFHSTPEAQNVRKIIKERFERGKKVTSSIGYQVLADEYTQEGRLLKDVKLFEWSLVNQPANPQATMFTAKGLTLATHSDAVLATVDELKARLVSLRDLRMKEGRVLSDANRKRIASLKDALAAVLTDLDDLLTLTQPNPEKARAVLLEALRLQAQMNGVQTS